MTTVAWITESPASAAAHSSRRRVVRSGAPAGLGGELLAILRRSARDLHQAVMRDTRERRWRRVRRPLIADYLARHETKKLHLGSGPVHLDGWLNADLRPRTEHHIFLNVLEPFPFADNTFDCVMSEHMIGDLTYDQCSLMMRESRRVRRPGGRIRLSTPSLERLSALYSATTSPGAAEYVRWAVDEYVEWADAYLPGLVINNMFQEYPFVYDADILTLLLGRNGFEEMHVTGYGKSAHRELAGIESHGRVLSNESVSRYESIVIEGAKPIGAVAAA